MTEPAHTLPSGGAVRHTGPTDGAVVVCVNGGRAGAVPGDWSPSVEWLVRRLAPEFPGLGFTEVRYRVKSWRQLESCIQDGMEAIDTAHAAGARRLMMLGFSMGGAVSLACAAMQPIEQIIALAPWIPEQLNLRALAGRRVAVYHGTLDGVLPGIPALRPGHSLAGVVRMRNAGVDAHHTVIRGAVHGVALRPFGRLVPLVQADEWERSVRRELERFAG